MTRRLLAPLLLTVLGFALVAQAQPPQPGPKADPKAKPDEKEKQDVDPKAVADAAALKQERMARQFRDFENALLRLKQRLQDSPRPEDKQKALILDQAIKKASTGGIDTRFDKLVKAVADSKTFDDLEKLKDVIAQNQDLMKDIQDIIKILLTDNRDEELRKERERIEAILKKLNQLIRDQRTVWAWTERRAKDPERLGKEQGNVTKDAQDLVRGAGKPGDKDQEKVAKAEAKGEGKKGDAGKPEGKNDTGDPKAGDKAPDAKAGDAKDQKAGEPKDGQQGDAKPGEAKDGKPGDPKDGQQGEAKPGEPKDGKPGDAKPGQPKDDKQGDAKPGEPKEGQPGAAKPAEPKPAEAKPGAGKPGDMKDGKPGDAKPAQAKNTGGKPSEGKGRPDNKGDAKPSDGKPGQQQQQSPPKGGQQGQQGQQGQGKGDDQQQQQQQQPPPGGDKPDGYPGKQKIHDAIEKMKKAEQEIKRPDNEKAAGEQEKAIKDLEAAKKKLEELLRQLREEEIERVLAQLQMRCERMLAMQIEVRDGTVAVHKDVEARPNKRPDRPDQQTANKLSEREEEIVRECTRAIELLAAEGSAVAFPEVFLQLRDDMQKVAARLRQTDVGPFTQKIENYIIDTLKEMIEALKKARAENGKKPPGQPGPQGQPPDPKLIDILAELKMIRSLQIRINRMTEDYAKEYQGEQAPAPGQVKTPEERERAAMLLREMKGLAERQQKIGQITNDIYRGKNK